MISYIPVVGVVVGTGVVTGVDDDDGGPGYIERVEFFDKLFVFGFI